MISRSEWGARGGRGDLDGAKRILVIHHSVSAPPSSYDTRAKRNAHMRQVEDQHLGQGWAGIGYNFVMFPAVARKMPAEIYEGRGWDHVPAAQLNANTGTLALCVVGNFERDRLGLKGRGRIVRFAKRAKRRKGITRMIGHRNIGSTATACPGSHLYALLPKLRRRAKLSA